MKKKNKKTIFSLPVILLSLFLGILIFSFSPKIPKSPPFSFLNLISRPASPQGEPISHFPPLTSLVAVGDIMLGRYVNVQIQRQKDWRYPFLKTAEITANADIAFANLEAPFIENCPTRSDGMVFCARPESIEGLKFAGFDILSLANNHTLNYGQEGLDQTKLLLEKNGISYSCPSNPSCSSGPSIIIKNNIKFGFLSFNLLDQILTITHDREQMSIIQFIKDEAKNVDVLIVSLHWGNEYQKQPTKSQVDLAHQIIDAGAKIIIGHHPHVTQPAESYHNGLIFYSLGNFIFDQPWSEETKKGEIAKIIFEGKEIKSYETIPIYIKNYCQPVFEIPL